MYFSKSYISMCKFYSSWVHKYRHVSGSHAHSQWRVMWQSKKCQSKRKITTLFRKRAKGKFYICQHIWHHSFRLGTKFNGSKIYTKNIALVIVTNLVIQTKCLISVTHVIIPTSKGMSTMSNKLRVYSGIDKLNPDTSNTNAFFVVANV